LDSCGLAAGPLRSQVLAPVDNEGREFARHGVIEICDFLTASEFERLLGYVDGKVGGRLFRSMEGDGQVGGAPCEYADPVAEQILSQKTSYLCDILGLDLVPTYSYLRLYRPGDRLSAHRDRPACEITVSTSLAAASRWPLSILVSGRVVDYCPAARSAVAFRGHELLHWRDPLAAHGSVAQALFHYVDRHGPFQSWAYDRRPRGAEAQGKSAPCW
jgi:hypothetical protein